MRAAFLTFATLLLAACTAGPDDGVTDVAIVGSPEDLAETGLRLSYGGQHIRAATRQGLVALDAQGQVVPALAERWIVTDDATSYIFRIREIDIAEGERLTAQAVRDALRQSFGALDNTTMGLDLAKVRDVRALTSRVVEIRLTSPMPAFLQLLAQPELAMPASVVDAGPMRMATGDSARTLAALPPQMRGLPEREDFEDLVRPVKVQASDAATALQGFAEGRIDLVLGGRLADLPRVDTGPLARGTLRLDPAIGLFGLDVKRARGFLAAADNREALAMAIDRQALVAPFNIGGWLDTTRIVPAALSGEIGDRPERWADRDIAERRTTAAARVDAWSAANGGRPSLALALPQGPGSDTLFAGLAEQLATIGIALRRADTVAEADLVLRDRVARYGSSRWFLNQFNCKVTRGLCSEDVDFLVELANEATSAEERASYLAEAEAALVAQNGFIPLGAPIRWAVARSDVAGFAENPWAIHPLFPLSLAPM